jgi:hypothetical protein
VSADERVAAVLAQHRALIVYSTSLLACSCTVARHSDAPRFTDAEHRAHVAAALAPVLNEVRAEALWEAADELGSGPTMRVLVERESCDWWTDRRVADWLRARANRIGGTP